jgi:hypothetical protein
LPDSGSGGWLLCAAPNSVERLSAPKPETVGALIAEDCGPNHLDHVASKLTAYLLAARRLPVPACPVKSA